MGALALAELLPPMPQAEMALPPVQAIAVLNGDPSVPAAVAVFSGREVGLEDSAPSI